MFEDATFESMGTIHTRSRNWMLATFGLNGSIIAILIAIPLIYPSVLSKMESPVVLEAPPPVEETPPVVRQAPAPTTPSEMSGTRILAPSLIPTDPYIPTTAEPQVGNDVIALGSGPGTGSADNPFGGHHTETVVQQAPQPVRHISQGVMEGMLLNRVLPVYPSIARATRQEGTVQLQATISRAGTIENLHVVSGPPMLQQAAIDAVKQWRYRPYLLNGDPVEVETTINVEFKLN
jgi:periplasmic protein TonB